MDGFERFIIENGDADIPRLLLSCKEWPSPSDPLLSGLDPKALATGTLEARKKLRKKVPEWYGLTSLAYPDALCAEQCSSSVTARYKAGLAGRILHGHSHGEKRIADLTGGLGIDSWAFCTVADEVLYNEMAPSLLAAARHNFKELGIQGNIRFSGREVSPGSLQSILGDFGPGVIFIDPARRSPDGKKVFLLEDCSPDVLQLLPSLLGLCRHLLLKLSPMADIPMVVERLDRTYEDFMERATGSGWNGRWIREVHVVASGGECKELLVWMDREWNGEYSLTCREDGGILIFTEKEIASSKAAFPNSTYAQALFEPGKSLTKAGAFNALCERFSLVKLGRFTHLYTFGEPLSEEGLAARMAALQDFGKLFMVKEFVPMDKSSMKEIGRKYPRSEVSAKNIPLTSEELRSRLGVSSGSDAHIFGARVEMPYGSGNYLIACQPA